MLLPTKIPQVSSSSWCPRAVRSHAERQRLARAGQCVISAFTLCSCLFTPPAPLDGPDAAAEGAADDSSAGAGAPEGAGAVQVAPSDRSFAQGTPAPPDLSEADRLAYNLAQGDPLAAKIAEGGAGFSMAEAVEGLDGDGTLTVVFNTARGPLECELFEAQAPRTVANFVGLARGLRPFRDHETGAWIKRPYYDAIEFHRVIPGFMVQAGDPTGTGRESAGYVIADEFVTGVEHDAAGRLSMANRGPGTGSAQFFITLGPTPHLDGLHTIFGQCDAAGIELAKSIASVPRDDSDHPVTSEPIETVVIERR